MKFYTASKTRHAEMWRRLRDMKMAGVEIISTWIDEAGEGETDDHVDLAKRCISEPSEADATILYVEPGDALKGALIEVGAALACGKFVYAIGDTSFATVFQHHPKWRRAESLSMAIEHARREHRSNP